MTEIKKQTTDLTPEQIIEDLATLASYYGNDFNGNETQEHKALTAALEYIKDMREIEAAAERLREAFKKAVKGGKD